MSTLRQAQDWLRLRGIDTPRRRLAIENALRLQDRLLLERAADLDAEAERCRVEAQRGRDLLAALHLEDDRRVA